MESTLSMPEDPKPIHDHPDDVGLPERQAGIPSEKSYCRLRSTEQGEELRCYWLHPSKRAWLPWVVLVVVNVLVWWFLFDWQVSGLSTLGLGARVVFVASGFLLALRYALGVTVLRFDGQELEIRRGPLLWPSRTLIPAAEIGTVQSRMHENQSEIEGGHRQNRSYTVRINRTDKRPVWVICHQPSWVSAQRTIKAVEMFFHRAGIR